MASVMLCLMVAAIDGAFYLGAEAAMKRAGVEVSRPFYVSIVSGLAFVLQISFLLFMPSAQPAAFMIFTACLAACILTDVSSGLILDAVTLPTLAALGILSGPHFLPFAQGAISNAGIMLLLYVLTAGRGMGLGDVKLAACIGAFLGTARGLQSIGVAFIIGGAVAVGLLAAGLSDRKMSVPFAPYLAAGTFAVLVSSRL